MEMIIITIIIEIILIALCVFFYKMADDSYDFEVPFGIGSIICVISIFIIPIAIGLCHGYINYYPSNDRDLARITAITQKQNIFTAYYEVEVEYLTSADKKVEKDTMYLYYDNEETAKKIKENLYKEVWITSGYKGGYETYKDFGTNLIKDIELKE